MFIWILLFVLQLVAKMIQSTSLKQVVKHLSKAFKNKIFSCLIEAERVPTGSERKKPALLVCKELEEDEEGEW